MFLEVEYLSVKTLCSLLLEGLLYFLLYCTVVRDASSISTFF